ncbi:MAG: ATP-binding protein, partial [Bacteroidota bacterium]
RLDPVRLRQVLNNLVDNAIKYSSRGNIVLGYGFELGQIKFEVSDEGQGIPKEELDRIFERFEQLEKNELRTSGSGLGLAICKGIVKAMKGEIIVDSEPGRGSTFSVYIPLEPASEHAAQELSKTKKTSNKLKQKILIAEDSTSIQLYYQNLLKDTKIELIMADDGQEAVELFKKNRDVTLVLMDLKMPRMNGEEAFEAIKKMSSETPIIAQSAFAMNDEIQRFKEMGFADYITKPIDEEKLMEVLNTYSLSLETGEPTT